MPCRTTHLNLRRHGALAQHLHQVVALRLRLEVLAREGERVAERGGGDDARGRLLLAPHPGHHRGQHRVHRLLRQRGGVQRLAHVAERLQGGLLHPGHGGRHIRLQRRDEVRPLADRQVERAELAHNLRGGVARLLHLEAHET